MMRGLQQVVCRGAIDPDFLRSMLRSPVESLRGFDLAPDEAAMLIDLRPQSFDELATGIEAWRRGDVVLTREPARAGPALAAALAG